MMVFAGRDRPRTPSLCFRQPMPLFLEVLAGAGSTTIEFEGLDPHRLKDRTAADLSRMPVQVEGRPAELGEVIAVRGDCGDGRIECHGDFSRVHGIAAGMHGGEVLVRGSVGRHAGNGMTGGRLVVEGGAGDWLAAGIRGGSVQVRGNAGDNVAAPPPGDNHGMRGGLVSIDGNAGCLAGTRMRRGILAIGGDCGPGAGFEMRAGTVIVAGVVGPLAAFGMRRGSLIACGPPPAVPATFLRGVDWSPPFFELLAGRLEKEGFRPRSGTAARLRGGLWRQWHGDLLCGARGEIFHRERHFDPPLSPVAAFG